MCNGRNNIIMAAPALIEGVIRYDVSSFALLLQRELSFTTQTLFASLTSS